MLSSIIRWTAGQNYNLSLYLSCTYSHAQHTNPSTQTTVNSSQTPKHLATQIYETRTCRCSPRHHTGCWVTKSTTLRCTSPRNRLGSHGLTGHELRLLLAVIDKGARTFSKKPWFFGRNAFDVLNFSEKINRILVLTRNLSFDCQ